MEQTRIIGPEYVKLTKDCPKCHEFLVMETTYQPEDAAANDKGEYVYSQYQPYHRVRCMHCGFMSPEYKTAKALFARWETKPYGEDEGGASS